MSPLAFAKPGDCVLHYDFRPGRAGVRPVVFANSLGTDLRIWNSVREALDPNIPTLAMDKRGHGLSANGVADIPTLAGDVAAMMDRLGLGDALVCGVSVGGLIAQALASARPDLVAGLMLCNTGAKIGDAESWNARIAAVSEDGLEAMADGILERWFAPCFRLSEPVAMAGWRAMLVRTPERGYAAVCAALRDADRRAETAALTVPTLCVAGVDDLATPPGLVQALANLIDGARFECLDGVGHLPCIEAPEHLARLLTEHYARLP